MTISSSVTTSGPYAGAGTTDTFAYAFRILAAANLIVTETVNSVETVLTLTTHYTVTGVGDSGGGNVVRVAGNLPSGSTWFIERDTALTQLIDFGAQGDFDPQTWEDGLDKLMMLQQEFNTELLRSVQSPATEAAIALLLPLVAARKNMLFEFDAAGLPAVSINAVAAAAAVTASLASGTAVSSDAFTGDGATIGYTMSVAPASANGVLVTLDGVLQQPVIDYTVASSTITFTSAPPDGSKIVIRNFGNASSIIQVNQRGTVTLSAGSASVTLPITAPDANYRIALGGDADERFYWSAKIAASFTINSSNGSSTAAVDWMISH